MGNDAKIIRIIFLLSIITLHFTGILPARSSEKDIQIVGWIENVTILPQNMKIKAKLDTGARHSSLNAVNITEFKRDGDSFVRFDLTNWKGRTETLEAKVFRMARIKQHNSAPEYRFVIRLGICLENVYKDVEVNLVNRSNFNYQLLIGRSYLKGGFAVDSAKTFTIKTDCSKALLHE